MGPHPSVAAIRHAVRASLGDLEPGDLVLAACSGGADSLALAAALAFEGPRAAIRAGGITIDHGLQPGSAAQAQRAVQAMQSLGLSPVLSVAVTVADRGSTEAAARAARYAALENAGEAASAVTIMLGHTLDDQAETVLLGLARGSGARSLAGMAPVAGRFRRPLLAVRREQTRLACSALGLAAWEDPQNSDPAYTRTRVRAWLLPALTQALGPGVPEALARTADLLRADADVLDCAAAAQAQRIAAADRRPADGSPADGSPAADGWPTAELAALPAALRRRILRAAAIEAGSPAGSLSYRHIAGMDEMVTSWHGQRWTDLPGGVRCQRRYGRLIFIGPDGPQSAASAEGE